MKSVKVYHYDAFSKEPNKGNPAGVVLDGENLTDMEMQEITAKVGFNETAFPLKSDIADLRIRYFTPGHETDLCGHATIASIFALKSRGLLTGKDELTIETRAGVLPIRIESFSNDEFQITMSQASPQFKEFNGSSEELAHSIGLEKIDIDADLPIVYGSTGAWTLLVPIKTLSAFNRMKPNTKIFPTILEEMPKASIHPFCLETYDRMPNACPSFLIALFRHNEDAVTGTASGVMGAFYATYINNNFEDHLDLVVEQGHEIEKDGRVMVRVTKNRNRFDIEITGIAVYVKEIEVVI